MISLIALAPELFVVPKRLSKMKVFQLFVCACVVWGSLTANAQNKNYAPAIQSSRDSMFHFMKRNRVAGAAITVSVNGKVVWSEGFGFSDLEQHVKVDPAKTKFRIASISKSITATAMAVLYEQGKIQLDSSVEFYLPNFPKKKYRPTVRQLAGHLAGIRFYKGLEFLISKRYASLSDGLSIFQDDSLLCRPGTKYNYSTYGFNLLGVILEKASGREFLGLVGEQVFKPLQLNHTVADFNDSLIADRGRYYDVLGSGWVNAPFVDNSYKWAGGGFLSTSEDIAKFGSAYLRPGFLKQETIELFTTSQKLADGTETFYGMGWANAKDKKGIYWFGHSGGAIGGSSKLVVYPYEKIVVSLLTNITGAKIDNLANSIADLFMK